MTVYQEETTQQNAPGETKRKMEDGGEKGQGGARGEGREMKRRTREWGTEENG